MTASIFEKSYFQQIVFSTNHIFDKSCSDRNVHRFHSFFSSQFEKPLRKINWTEDNCFYSSFRLTSDAGKRENIKFRRFSFNLFVLLCVGSTFEAKRIKRSPVDQAVMGLNPYQVHGLIAVPIILSICSKFFNRSLLLELAKTTFSEGFSWIEHKNYEPWALSVC